MGGLEFENKQIWSRQVSTDDGTLSDLDANRKQTFGVNIRQLAVDRGEDCLKTRYDP